MPSRPRDAFVSPRFAQPATFMRLPASTDLSGVDVAIVGVPFDGGTSYRPGSRLAPREIRAQSSLIRPYSHFQKVAPFDRLNVVDAGDVDASPVSLDRAYESIESGIAHIVNQGALPMAVGGDHSISLPILRALAKSHGPLALVQFDSHIDTWEQDFGSPYFHGSPFWHAVKEGLVDPARFIQVGLRGPMYAPDDFAFQQQHGITVRDIAQVREHGLARTMEDVRRVATGAAYVTFDIDVVDPAFAPGTGTPEVGGFTSEEAQRLVRGLIADGHVGQVGRVGQVGQAGEQASAPGAVPLAPPDSLGKTIRIVGCDLVEVSPPFDGPGHITSLLAANLLFEMLCVIARTR